MRKIGCVLGIFGAILCIASFILLGRSILRATEARTVETIPMNPGTPLKTESLSVNTSRFCMLALRAKIESHHVKQVSTSDSNELVLQYAFPFKYTIYDQTGKILATETTEFSDNDGKVHTKSNEHVTEESGNALITSDYEKFTVPSPGQIKIEAQLDPDSTYEATISDTQLLVYDNVSQHTKPVTIGIVLIAIGGPLGFVGVLLFMIGSIRKAENTSETQK